MTVVESYKFVKNEPYSENSPLCIIHQKGEINSSKVNLVRVVI